MSEPKPIHIALTFDDNFWAPAYATMRSVCYFTRRRTDLVFHLCHLGLSTEHQADLDSIATEYGASVVHHDLSATDFLGKRVAMLKSVDVPRLHQIVYARLFLFEILPPDVGRILFLDSDLFVRINIERLYEMDMGDNIAAAALDPYRTAFQLHREGKARRYLDSAAPYFNAGVILFGKECAEIDFVTQLVDLLTPEEINGIYFDQDTLNLVLAGRWHVLSHRWNLQNPRLHDENKDPFIVHYTGPNKPWQIRTKTAFKPLYRHLMTNELFYRFWWFNLRRRLKKLASTLTFGMVRFSK